MLLRRAAGPPVPAVLGLPPVLPDVLLRGRDGVLQAAVVLGAQLHETQGRPVLSARYAPLQLHAHEWCGE